MRQSLETSWSIRQSPETSCPCGRVQDSSGTCALQFQNCVHTYAHASICAQWRGKLPPPHVHMQRSCLDKGLICRQLSRIIWLAYSYIRVRNSVPDLNATKPTCQNGVKAEQEHNMCVICMHAHNSVAIGIWFVFFKGGVARHYNGLVGDSSNLWMVLKRCIISKLKRQSVTLVFINNSLWLGLMLGGLLYTFKL